MNYKFNIIVVLVKTLYDRNIGSASRVMSNMGYDNLILISPQCNVTYEAQLAAATGQTALQNRKIYATWEEFYKSEVEGVRIAFTARDGRGRLVKDFDSQLKWYLEKLKSEDTHSSETAHSDFFKLAPQNIYLIFGPEDAGLAATDLENINFCAFLPTYGENASLNLSHAVLMALFILRQNIGGLQTPLNGSQKEKTVVQEPMKRIGETLKEWLILLGVNLDEHPKTNAYTVIHKMLLQNIPTTKEHHMLETMLQQTIRKLKLLKELESKEL